MYSKSVKNPRRIHPKEVIIESVKSFLLALLIGFPQLTQAADEKMAYCRTGKTVRMVRVVAMSQGTGCNTVYSKGGKENTVGSASNWKSCHEIFENIKRNLEKADWKCRVIESADIVSADERAAIPEKSPEHTVEKLKDNRSPAAVVPPPIQ